MANATPDLRVCRYCSAPLSNHQRIQCGSVSCRRQHGAAKQREFTAAYRAANGQRYRSRFDDERAPGRRPHTPDTYKRNDDLRRARKAGAVVEPVDSRTVYERDGWVCRLCHEPVDPTLRYPDSRSASLDHAVPLSRGGDHSYANSQLAHLGCNVRKGARMEAE